MPASRLGRTAISLLAVVGAYLVYSMLVVPLIEPRRESSARTPHRPAEPPAAEDEFRTMLRELFPPDSWEAANPLILRNEQSALLFQEFQQAPNREVSLFPCSVVLSPETENDAKESRAPIVMQAPQGAVLRFDRPLDLRTGTVGKPVSGRLVGDVRIRSEGVGGRGKLLVQTSNVRIDAERIWTTDRVEFHYDGSQGSGRDLIIRLVDPKTAARRRSPMAYIQSMELVHLDELIVDAETSALMSSGPTAKERVAEEIPRRPLRISCQGPCRIDLTKGELTFEDCVDVRQAAGDKLEDFIRCALLKLLFQSVAVPHAATHDESSRATSALDRVPVHIQRLIATGNPVVLHLASRSLYIEGARLEYDQLARSFRVFSETEATPLGQRSVDRRLSLSPREPRLDAASTSLFVSLFCSVQPGLSSGQAQAGGSAGDNGAVQLRYGTPGQTHELWTRQLEYRLGVPGSLGTLQATGPGRFRHTSIDHVRPLEVTWQQQLDFRRMDPGHLLEFVGQVHAISPGSGEIQGDRIQLSLEDAPRRPNHHTTSDLSLRLRHCLATGNVRFTSEQLSVICQRLQTHFRHEPPSARPLEPTPYESRPVMVRTSSSNSSVRQSDIRSARQESSSGSRDTLPAEDTIDVAGHVIDVWVTLSGQTVQQIDKIDVHGVPAPPEERDASDATPVKPRESATPRQSGLSQITARGMRLQAGGIRFDHAKNLIWSDGYGSLEMPIQQAVGGMSAGAGRRATVTWYRKMECDGQQITFHGQVGVTGPDFSLQADQAHAYLNRPVRFGTHDANVAAIDIDRLSVAGNVRAEYRTVQRGQLESLTLFQAGNASLNRQTGNVLVRNAGTVTSVRRSFRSGVLMTPSGSDRDGSKAWSRANSHEDHRLSFLRVDFQGGMQGNVYQKQMTFDRHVQTLYGPVNRWDEQIAQGSDLGPEDISLVADQLIVAQLPTDSRSPPSMDLRAIGNVIVEGQQFTARGHRVSYDQGKDMMILLGSGQTDASIAVRQEERPTWSETLGREIQFRPSTRQIRFNDVRQLDFRTRRKSGK
jgi:hypothetical protein